MIIMKSLSQTNLPLFLKESTLRTLRITQICRPKTVSLHQVKFVYGVLVSWLWGDVMQLVVNISKVNKLECFLNSYSI